MKIRVSIFIDEFKYLIDGEIDNFDEPSQNHNIFGILLKNNDDDKYIGTLRCIEIEERVWKIVKILFFFNLKK